jgi:hypothetical protein
MSFLSANCLQLPEVSLVTDPRLARILLSPLKDFSSVAIEYCMKIPRSSSIIFVEIAYLLWEKARI